MGGFEGGCEGGCKNKGRERGRKEEWKVAVGRGNKGEKWTHWARESVQTGKASVTV